MSKGLERGIFLGKNLLERAVEIPPADPTFYTAYRILKDHQEETVWKPEWTNLPGFPAALRALTADTSSCPNGRIENIRNASSTNLTIPRIIRSEETLVTQPNVGGDYSCIITSENHPEMTVGLIADGITDPEYPEADIALNLLLQELFPTLVRERDQYAKTDPKYHLWTHRTNALEPPAVMVSGLLLALHRKILAESKQKSIPYKATGCLWVKQGNTFYLDWWGDTKWALLASPDDATRPLLVRESPPDVTEAITGFPALMSQVSADSLLPLTIRRAAEEAKQRYTKESYRGTRFNASQEASIGALGYPGDFFSHVFSTSFTIPDNWQWRLVAYSDGLKDTAGIFNLPPWLLGLIINELHQSYPPFAEEYAQITLRLIIGNLIHQLLSGTYLPHEEIRAKKDDVSCQVIGSDGFGKWLHFLAGDLRRYTTAFWGDAAMKQQAGKVIKALGE